MFFLNRFSICFNLFVIRFHLIPCLLVGVQPCMEWILIKKKFELAHLVPLTHTWGRSTHYSGRLHDFSVAIPRCYKDVNSVFLCTARLLSSLPVECFPVTYDLNGLKSRINRHLFNCRLFLNRLPVCFNLFVFVFLLTPCLIVTVQSCMEWIPILKKSCKKKSLFLR